MQAAAQERVKAFAATGNGLLVKFFMMLGSNEAWKDGEAAMLDLKIMVAAPEGNAAHLHHSQAPSVGTIIQGHLFKRDYTVCYRMELKILGSRRQIIEEKDGALAPGKKVLEREDLAAVA